MCYEIDYLKLAQRLHMSWEAFSKLPYKQRKRLVLFCDTQADYEHRKNIGDKAVG